jgi:glycosyltransferase involved in cell wall biosynthesis
MDRGGAETMIMNLYRNVDRTKIQFDFVENEGDETAFDAEIRSMGGRIYHCPRYRGKNHFAYTRWWHTFFKEHPNQYPIVHGHIGSTAAIYLSIAKKYGAFTIAHSHSAGEGSAMYRVFSYPTRFVADHFFACSKAAGISRYGRLVGMDHSRCDVLNHAVDAQKFAYSLEIRAKIRKVLEIADNALVVGHTGRFVDVKNHTFLLDVFADLLKIEPRAMLLLVGDGELRPQIEQKIQTLNIESNVILTGIQSNVWDYYQSMDVFVFPSLYEGLPLTLVEAQASGLPCCISDTVPAESAVTELACFRSLEDGTLAWVNWILERAKEPRRNMFDRIVSTGYEISATSKWLENFYTEVVKNRG